MEGLTNKQIGIALGIFEGTVKVHVKVLMRLYAAPTRTAFAMEYVRRQQALATTATPAKLPAPIRTTLLAQVDIALARLPPEKQREILCAYLDTNALGEVLTLQYNAQRELA